MPVRQPIEEAYFDVFQNLEFNIVQFYRQNPELTDWDVERAIEELIRHYQALWRGREPRAPRLKTERRQELYELLAAMCEFRLGNATMVQAETGEELALPIEIEPLTLEEIIAVLKRLRKSVRLWNKRGGVRGYLTFIEDFFPTSQESTQR